MHAYIYTYIHAYMHAYIHTHIHMVWNGMVWYSSIYIAPLNNRGPTEALLVRLAPLHVHEKRQVLRSDKEVERLDDKKEARTDGGRRFQREGQATEKI